MADYVKISQIFFWKTKIEEPDEFVGGSAYLETIAQNKLF